MVNKRVEHGEVLCRRPPAREYIEKYGGTSKLEVVCFERNRRGQQGPHLDDLISLAEEFGLYSCGYGGLLTECRMALSCGLKRLLCLEWIGREQN